MIRIDGAKQTIDLLVDEAELETRRAAWVAPDARRLGGLFEKYAAVVGPAKEGAVTHSGGVEWVPE